jgi:antitoxin HigA-1
MGRGEVGGGTALRLGRYFGTTPQFWPGFQMDYDLGVAADELAERLESEVLAYGGQ